MQNNKSIAVLGAVLFATGCGGGGDSAPAAPVVTSITIASQSGTARALDGTWISCSNQGGVDIREELVVSGTSFAMHKYTGTAAATAATATTLPTCAGGTLDPAGEVVATIGTTSTVAFAGWLDPAVGTGSFATAPAGLTPTSLTVVPVTGTWGGAPLVFSASFWINDTNTVYAMHQGKNGGVCPQTAAGLDQCLSTANVYYK